MSTINNEEYDFYELGKTYAMDHRDEFEKKMELVEQNFGKRKAVLFEIGFSSVIEVDIDVFEGTKPSPVPVKKTMHGDIYITPDLGVHIEQTIDNFIRDFKDRLSYSSLSLEAIETIVELLDEFELYEAEEIYELDGEGIMPMDKRVEFETILRGYEFKEEQELAKEAGGYTPDWSSIK